MRAAKIVASHDQVLYRQPIPGSTSALLCTSACVSAAQVSATTTFSGGQLSAEQYLAVAEVAERAGDIVRGQQYLLAARVAGADEAYVLPRLLRLYAKDRQYRLAIEHAEDYLRRHPGDVPLEFVLASLYRAVGRDSAADQLYQRILAAEPAHAEAQYNLGILLHDAGHELGRADAYLRLYLELQPHGEHAGEARALLLTEVP